MCRDLLPRLIRLRDIPQYLGMDRRIFDKLVRPHLTEIPVGIQGKAFDRLELDKWVDHYKESKGMKLWDVKENAYPKSVPDVLGDARTQAPSALKKRESGSCRLLNL